MAEGAAQKTQSQPGTVRHGPMPVMLSRYLIPLATAVLLGVCFVVYYLGYVQQHREYLLNRNYRVLATLGAQISETLANQSSILRSYADGYDDSQFMQSRGQILITFKRNAGQPDEPIRRDNFELKQLIDTRDEIHTFAPHLKHIKFWKVPGAETPPKPGLVRQDGEWAIQLAVIDPDGDHEATATISLQDVSLSFSPSLMETFDDVLIASEDPAGDGSPSPGEIVYQKQAIGRHFSTVSNFLKSGARAKSKPDETGQDSNPKAAGSEQLKEGDLGGLRYMAFLEPVTIDVSHNRKTEQRVMQHFTVAGLVQSRRFQWQSLAVSYQTIIFVSSSFLLLCLSTPVIKILFFNARQRLRLWEIALLPLLWVTMAGVLTSICLQTIYFYLQRDDTDGQLERLSRQMSENIGAEIEAMRDQLMVACGEPDLLGPSGDSQFDLLVVRTKVLSSEFQDPQGKNLPYPYFSNIFWTDDKGNQTVKWSATKYFTPLISVGDLEFFRTLKFDNRFFFLKESKPPFRLDSVLPPNQDNHVAVLGMRASDCGQGVESERVQFAFLSAKPLSLINPTLPLGFGFALVDDTGAVLFHSDKYRNNRENILVETSNNLELMASLYGHLNARNFSLSYRGNEVRGRVAAVAGLARAPWSLFVYRDARYMHTYDLEVITMAGSLLLCYLAIPAFTVCCFYLLVQPRYVPAWLWPSESARPTYIFQIEAGIALLGLSAILIFLTGIEQSIYAAAAAGYMALMLVVASHLAGKPSARFWTIFLRVSWFTALLMVVVPLLAGWYASILLGFVPVALVGALRASKSPAAPRCLARLSFLSVYHLRAIVLLTVVGILPPLSFFRNSMLLEDLLHIRAAQLRAAEAWNARERAIENLDKEVPGVSSLRSSGTGKEKRCDTEWDRYLRCCYFKTEVSPAHHSQSSPPRGLHIWFLRLAHELHHAFNEIGAEALGALPEPVYSDKSSTPSQESGSSTVQQGRPDNRLADWEWESPPPECPRCPRLRLHQGATTSAPCAANQPDLVVSSWLPDKPVSTTANLGTWLLVITAVGVTFWMVTRKIFLFDIAEPLSHTAGEIRRMLEGSGNMILVAASRQDWSPDLAGAGALRIDIRKLAADPGWAEKFTEANDRAGVVQAEGPVVVENFDWELDYPECNRQRLILLERLTAGARKIIVVSTVDPIPFLIGQNGRRGGAEAGRWAAVLGGFRRVNFATESSWPMEADIRKDAPLLWEECHVRPELQRIGEDLWRLRNPRSPWTPEQVVAEVLERAAEYYYLEWRSCTHEERFLLAGLAEDGMLNPKNTASLRQLLRRKLIVRSPQFRIVNESFRRFVRVQPSKEMRNAWEAAAAGSGWGKARGAFATFLVLGGLFLLATQQQFLQTSTGLLTAAGGGVAAILKLVAAVQGKSSKE